MLMNTELIERLDQIKAAIVAAAERSERDPGEVTLIAVTKTHPARLVDQALAVGITHIAENRVQEAEEKWELLQMPREHFRGHLIGHLQRNKARRALALFDMIHSVDSVRLAETLNRLVNETSTTGQQRLPILLQVNVSGEESKEGFQLVGGWSSPRWTSFLESVRQIVELPFIDVQGLMTIAPFSDDAEGVVRPCFRALRHVRDQLRYVVPQSSWPHLSMGMSGDFEIAIEEGATLVRLGTALFGAR